MSFHLSKIALAILVGVAATNSYAVDYALGTGAQTFTGTIAGPLTLNGQRVQAGSTDTVGVQLKHANVQGPLLNQGDFTFTSGKNVIGLGIDQGFAMFGSGGSVIDGDVTNNGTLSISNATSAEVVEVGSATIHGSVINNGTIRFSQMPDTIFGMGEGIYLHGSTIDGDIVNNGTIDITAADGAVALIIDADGGRLFNLGGKVINNGTLRGTGDESTALDIETATTPIVVENAGLMEANGTESTGVVFYEPAQIDVFRNTGVIRATGTDSAGIRVNGSPFTANLPSGARGIVNTGTIEADDTAIRVDHDAWSDTFEINQQAGLIKGGIAAIDGYGAAVLNWSGGAIEGDVIDVSAIHVTGLARYRGALLDSDVDVASGSLALQQQGTRISGNLSVASGGAVDMLLSDAVVATTPYLTVDGTASFAPNSKVTLSANPGDFKPTAAGTEYRLVKAQSLTNNGLTVASASSLLDVKSYSTDAQSVNAIVTLKTDLQVDSELTTAGASNSTSRTVNVLKNNVLGQLSADDAVFKAFSSASDARSLAKLSASLSPEVNRGGIDAAVSSQKLSSSAILGRMSGQRSGMSSGDTLQGTGVWAQGLSGNLDQDARRGVDGYSANSSGVAVGADGELNANTVVGLAYSYLNSNVTSDSGNKTQVQGNALSLYGSWNLDRWFIDGALTYGRNDNEGKRSIAGTLAKGDYDSDVMSLNALAGYGFHPTEHLTLEPRVGARYSSVQIDSYNEHGSSAALHNDSQRFEIGELGAGFRVASRFDLSKGTLTPEASVMAYHDFIGDRVNQTSSFVLGGSTFAVTGASPDRDSYEGSVGVSYEVNALTLGVSYNYQAKSGFDADTLGFKARYDF
uniref:Autotransporter outer membrane beta-barrel domain-containing protein n=1 Tax=Pseudomonas graminis TaxID=158627 RepID=A0A7C2B052_9PSED